MEESSNVGAETVLLRVPAGDDPVLTDADLAAQQDAVAAGAGG